MSSSLRIALVGTGKVAMGQHLPLWSRIDGAEVVAVCDTNRDSAEAAASAWNVPRVYADFQELIDKEERLVVDLCTPPASHVPLAVKALGAGHHVLLEKPISLRADECQELLRAYRNRKDDVELCIVHSFLYVWPMPEIREILRKEGLSVLGVDIRLLHTHHDEMLADPEHWVHGLPGGRFGENLIHPIYVLSSLLGDLRVRDVYTAKHGPHDWVPFDELFTTYDSDGKYGSIHVSFNSPRWTTPLTLTIYAKEAIIHFDGSNVVFYRQGELMRGYLPDEKIPRLMMFKDRMKLALGIIGSTASLSFQIMRHKLRPGHERLFRAFAKSLRDGTPPPVPAEEACKATLTFFEVLKRLESDSPTCPAGGSGREGA